MFHVEPWVLVVVEHGGRIVGHCLRSGMPLLTAVVVVECCMCDYGCRTGAVGFMEGHGGSRSSSRISNIALSYA